MFWEISSQKGTRTGCAGQWWNSHFWRDLTDTWMWHLGTQASGGLGSAGGAVGLNGLTGLFQLKPFCAVWMWGGDLENLL